MSAVRLVYLHIISLFRTHKSKRPSLSAFKTLKAPRYSIFHSITYDPATVAAAIVGINAAVVYQNLLLIWVLLGLLIF
jgi:hypothetical protein